MIYEIDGKAIYNLTGYKLVCWSFDGTRVLVETETPPESHHNSYDSSEKSTIMALPFWKQPCIGC